MYYEMMQHLKRVLKNAKMKKVLHRFIESMDTVQWYDEQRRSWSNRVDAQADLALCCVHMALFSCCAMNESLYNNGYILEKAEAFLPKPALVNQKRCKCRCHKSRQDPFFQLKSTDIFLIFPQKHMLWVLIRSASVRHF